MELKQYFDLLRDLTKTKQINWVRRPGTSDFIFDCISPKAPSHTITLWCGPDVITATMCHAHHEIANERVEIKILGLDKDGDTYRSLSKLWDAIVIANVRNSGYIDIWSAALPDVDTKVRFGPKENKAKKPL